MRGTRQACRQHLEPPSTQGQHSARTDSSSGLTYPAGNRPLAANTGSGRPGCERETARVCRCGASGEHAVSTRRRGGCAARIRKRALDSRCWSRVSTVSSSAYGPRVPARVSTQRQVRPPPAVTRALGQSAHFHGGPVASGFASLSLSSLSDRSSTRAACGTVEQAAREAAAY